MIIWAVTAVAAQSIEIVVEVDRGGCAQVERRRAVQFTR